MHRIRFALILLLASLIVGCVPLDSLNPLYTEKDVVFDSALLGQRGSDTEGLNFAKGDDGGYEMNFTGRTDKGQVVSYQSTAHLVNLQRHLFLDVVSVPMIMGYDASTVKLQRNRTGASASPRLIQVGPSAYLEIANVRSDESADLFEVKLRQAHEFFKVEFADEQKTLTLVPLDDKWVTEQVAAGKLAIDHEMVGDEHSSMVLAADTPTLQKLVLDHVDDVEVFNGATTMHRPGFERDAKAAKVTVLGK